MEKNLQRNSIKRYYKILSIITLIGSLIFLVIPDNMNGFFQKIWQAIGVNVAFHLTFLFLSRVPYGICKFLEKESPPISKFAIKLMKVFSITTMILAVLAALLFLKSIIDKGYYERIIMLVVFLAMFLGGYSSKFKLAELK